MPRYTGFVPVKRRRNASADAERTEHPERTLGDADGPDALTPERLLVVVAPSLALPTRGIHTALAHLLWSTDYVGHLLNELLQFPHVAVCPALPRLFEGGPSRSLCAWCACCNQEPVIALVSSLRSQRAVALSEDRATLLRLSSLCSTIARERSQKILPFSVVARALSWLMQRVPGRVWKVYARPLSGPAKCCHHAPSLTRH